ncbi:MAG: TIGR00266 family protein [Thermoplasmatota archaeon]
MQVTITHQPSFAKARVQLSPGEAVKAEAGALLAMEGDVDIKTASGGVMKGLKRAVLGGESFFQNTFTAGGAGGSVHLCPSLPGDLFYTRLQGHTLIVQDGSYLASAPTIQVDTKWQGARGFFSGEGFVMLKVSGQGDLILSSYGAIEQHDLKPGQRFTVDTGHIVAFTDGMGQNLRRLGGIKSTLFSGEGIVSEFTGPGTVWTQSRSSQSFLDWLARRLPGGGGSSGGEGVMGGLLGNR